jgi:hypothetical protein
LAISDKKIIPRKTELAEKLVYSDGIPPVPRNAKISEFRSEPIPRERKMLGIPYRGTKFKQNSRNFVPNHSAEEKTTRNSVPRIAYQQNNEGRFYTCISTGVLMNLNNE